MSDENKTEQVEEIKTETVEQPTEQPTEQSQPKQVDIDKVVKDRLYRQEQKILNDLGVNTLDDVKSALEERRKAEEEQQIERGKFDEVIKKKTQEYNEKLSKLETELKNERVDKQLINSASKHKAINPDQIKDLMKGSVQLNKDGKVEVLDKSGTPRYNKDGELLTVDEAVQEFLTQNAHFQSATPSGSGSVANVGKSNTNTTLNISDLDMTKPEDRAKYKQYKQERDKVTVINLNK